LRSSISPFVNVRRLRLATGLILFTFLATHLTNHALGLVSVDAMETGRRWFVLLWRNPLGTVALHGSLLTHFTLALVSLYRRRHFRLPAWEATQLLLGLVIPPLLIAHVVGTRIAFTTVGATDSYARVVLSLWHLRPDLGLRQAVVLLVAWTHGCVGLHFWLRLRPGYRRVQPFLLGAVVLLPATALLGFANAGRELSARASTPAAAAEILRTAKAPGPAARARLDDVGDALFGTFLASVLGVIAAREVRAVRARRRGLYRVSYPDGQRVTAPVGTTVLEASRLAGIPHASVCGGRGRCSTCRVRVLDGTEHLPPAAPEEARVLRRVGAPANLRLACQLRPTHDLSVALVLPATATAADAFVRPAPRAGQEREIAVLFADLRGFTRFAERRLPYDVVFLLNRYFEAVGTAVERCHGVVNQFTGDGVMAIFGAEDTVEAASRAAMAAAREIAITIDALTEELTEELAEPLRIGIGIHAGPAVVGHMGYGVARYLTAVGDTVHVASRLQDLTKEYDCQLVLSEPVARRGHIDVSGLPRHSIAVRNRAEPVVIYLVKDARTLKGEAA
jgi:adenylate cyclase